MLPLVNCSFTELHGVFSQLVFAASFCESNELKKRAKVKISCLCEGSFEPSVTLVIKCFCLCSQTYSNSYGVTNSVNSETFSADSPYFPFSNAPRRPPPQGNKIFLFDSAWSLVKVYYTISQKSTAE